MASSLTTRISLGVQATITDTAIVLPDGTSPTQTINYTKLFQWDTGTAINQADRIYTKSDTVTNGAPDTFDVAGSLTDLIGNTITMAKVCGIILVNKSTTAGEIMTLGAGTNPLLNWIVATGDGNKAGPGGAVVCLDPSVAAYAVTAATGDILQVAVAAGTAVPYDLFIIGRSA